MLSRLNGNYGMEEDCPRYVAALEFRIYIYEGQIRSGLCSLLTSYYQAAIGTVESVRCLDVVVSFAVAAVGMLGDQWSGFHRSLACWQPRS